MMKRTLIASVAAMALMGPVPAMAQSQTDAAGQKIEFIAQQKTGEYLASTLMGASVQNASGGTLGNVNDLIVNQDGNVTVAIIGVGGFLGIGEKNVGVAYDRMDTQVVNNELVAVLNTTKAELEAAPDFTNLKGQPLSVSKRLGDEAKQKYKLAKDKASETYNKAKDKASETYNKTKEEISGSDDEAKTE